MDDSRTPRRIVRNHRREAKLRQAQPGPRPTEEQVAIVPDWSLSKRPRVERAADKLGSDVQARARGGVALDEKTTQV